MDDQENPRVAIKKLKRLHEDFKSVADGEAKVLKMMRGFKNKHLVKAIAYYRTGQDFYFMFPWAKMGDLREFWKKQKALRTDQDYFIWVFTQLAGLSRALQELHGALEDLAHGAIHSSTHCRHGDLKPENILCFETISGQADQPRLVFTDVGLSKIHNKATEWRTKTGTTASTAMYAAPELGIDPHATRSRRFDIWSMGCIFLEFAIWLLYGPQELDAFSANITAFYEFPTEVSTPLLEVPGSKSSEKKTPRRHSKVDDYISYIKEDPRCSQGTAVQLLITLIETRLLIVKVDNSSPTNIKKKSSLSTKDQASSSAKTLPTIAEQFTEKQFTEEPDSLPEISLSEAAETPADEPDAASQTPGQGAGRDGAPQVKRRATVDLPPDPEYRAYAPEMTKELERILSGLKSDLARKRIDGINRKVPSKYPGPSHGQRLLAVSNPTRVR